MGRYKMIIDILEKCHAASEKEFFYGALLNKNIQDTYLGVGFLEPGEKEKKTGPGKGHEEIIYIINGEIDITGLEQNVSLKKGEAFFLADGTSAKLSNKTDERCYYVIAGGHTLQHSH